MPRRMTRVATRRGWTTVCASASAAAFSANPDQISGDLGSPVDHVQVIPQVFEDRPAERAGFPYPNGQLA